MRVGEDEVGFLGVTELRLKAVFIDVFDGYGVEKGCSSRFKEEEEGFRVHVFLFPAASFFFYGISGLFE